MPNILIIDDDKELTALLEEFLSNYNFSTSACHNPIKGVEMAVGTSVELVILDITMPEMDGFQLLRKIRESSAVPVIMLTARGEVSDRVVGLELGADDYMPKPFEPEELIARIQSILRRVQNPDTMVDQLVFEHLKIDKLTVPFKSV